MKEVWNNSQASTKSSRDENCFSSLVRACLCNGRIIHFVDFRLCSRGILHPYVSHGKLKSFYQGKLIHFFPLLAPNNGRVGCTKNENLGQFSSTIELSGRNKNVRVVFLCKGLSILASIRMQRK